MFKKWYFFRAQATSNNSKVEYDRYLTLITKAKNPIMAYELFKGWIKGHNIKEYRILEIKNLK